MRFAADLGWVSSPVNLDVHVMQSVKINVESPGHDATGCERNGHVQNDARVGNLPVNRIDQQCAANNDQNNADSPRQGYPHIDLDSKEAEMFQVPFNWREQSNT